MRLPRPGVVAGAAAAAVVVSVLLTSVVSQAPPAPAPGSAAVVVTSQPITSADLVCPVPATVKGVSQATVTAGAAGLTGAAGTTAPTPTGTSTPGASRPTATAGAGAPTRNAAPGSGTLSLYRLGGRLTAAPLAAVAAGASALRYAVPAGKAATLVLRATGAYAPGLTAAVTTRVSSGPGRSLQSVPCAPAGGDALTYSVIARDLDNGQ